MLQPYRALIIIPKSTTDCVLDVFYLGKLFLNSPVMVAYLSSSHPFTEVIIQSPGTSVVMHHLEPCRCPCTASNNISQVLQHECAHGRSPCDNHFTLSNFSLLHSSNLHLLTDNRVMHSTNKQQVYKNEYKLIASLQVQVQPQSY